MGLRITGNVIEIDHTFRYDSVWDEIYLGLKDRSYVDKVGYSNGTIRVELKDIEKMPEIDEYLKRKLEQD